MIVMETKSADAAEVKGGGAVATANPFEFTIIGSVTGVLDEVGDIIEPGAYAATLKKRTPKIIKDHEWGQRLGKVLSIEEYLPGDSRLPTATAQGNPWPSEAGALVAKVRLFQSAAGVEAAERWREYGPEQQYSIGYVVPQGQSTKTKDGIRRIKSLDLFEISDVLWGAMPLAGPMPELLATKMLTAIERGEDVADDPEDGPPTIEFDPFADDPETGEPGASWDDVLDAITAMGVYEHEPVDEAKVLEPDDEEPEVKASISAEKRRQMAKDGTALPDGSFPIENEQHLLSAIRMHGRGKADRAKVKRHIIKRARALGKTHLLPDSWKTNAKDVLDGLDIEVKYDTSPVGTEGGRQNWVDKVNGLPLFIRAIAHALIRNGHSEANAIQIAVGTVKRWAGGGGKVTAKTRAKAAAAVADWERKKGQSAATKGLEDTLDLFGYDPSLDGDCKAANGEMETKYLSSPRLPGTLEERQDALRRAVQEYVWTHMLPDNDDDEDEAPTETGADVGAQAVKPKPYVCIEGTYIDRVIISVEDYDGGNTDQDYYEMPYTFTDDDDVAIGDPVPVQLVVDIAPGVGAEDYHLGAMLSALADGVDGAKTLAAALETKAGRVLSGGNTERIKSAVQALIAVLAAAGVDVTGTGKPPADPTTGATSPVSPAEAKAMTLGDLPDPHALIAELRATAAQE